MLSTHVLTIIITIFIISKDVTQLKLEVKKLCDESMQYYIL